MRHQETCNPVVSRSRSFSLQPLRKVLRSRYAILSLALLLGSLAVARADDQIRAVRLSNVVGTVQLVNGPDSQFAQAYPNMPLMQGSTLKTGEDGRAEIQLEDGSVARLTPNSSATVSVLTRSAQGTNTELDLLTGLTYVEMTGTANARFVVRFGPNEVISPAPAKFRVNLDANPVEFAVLDGSAHLSNGTAYSVDVRSNETVRFDANDSSRYFLAQGVDGDSWDQWNADRDQAMSQMAAQQTREAIGSGNADPSFSDLDYYGNWYATNDGTNYWVPDGAGAGWDPYGAGYWGYYGGAGGYVWISGYPWGWAPYHCGTWNYFNPYWGWIPTGCGSSWYPVGGIWNAPPRYRRIPRPSPVHPAPSGGVRPVAKEALIKVDRGPEATTLTPRLGAAPKTIEINGAPAHLLAKTPNTGNTLLARAGSSATVVRSGYEGSQTVGNVPVYRSTAPSTGYRPGSAYSPSTARYSAVGQASASHGSMASSSPSAASSGFHGSSGGGAPASGGGGHVK